MKGGGSMRRLATLLFAGLLAGMIIVAVAAVISGGAPDVFSYEGLGTIALHSFCPAVVGIHGC